MNFLEEDLDPLDPFRKRAEFSDESELRILFVAKVAPAVSSFITACRGLDNILSWDHRASFSSKLATRRCSMNKPDCEPLTPENLARRLIEQYGDKADIQAALNADHFYARNDKFAVIGLSLTSRLATSHF